MRTQPYRDFFIDWNEFWDNEGTMAPDGKIVPDDEHLKKLFMRKPDLPILRVCFPDGSRRVYWNTFYQKVEFDEIGPHDFAHIEGLHPDHAATIADTINQLIAENADLEGVDLGEFAHHKDEVLSILCHKRDYLGQMDLNARSELVWDFYDETLKKLRDYGAKIIRLDAFAYLHKEPGQPNFFNLPGTWEYLDILRDIAQKYELIIFPEIHAEYGAGIHEEIAQRGFPVYDFFFPGLLIDALDRGTNEALLRWIADIKAKGLQTINMLGCHDGLPVLDLKGKQVNGSVYRPGLLDDEQIEATMDRIVEPRRSGEEPVRRRRQEDRLLPGQRHLLQRAGRGRTQAPPGPRHSDVHAGYAAGLVPGPVRRQERLCGGRQWGHRRSQGDQPHHAQHQRYRGGLKRADRAGPARADATAQHLTGVRGGDGSPDRRNPGCCTLAGSTRRREGRP